MSKYHRRVYERREGQAYSVGWIVDAPWAHPVWNQYLVTLYDLTTPTEHGAPTIYLEGATHEFIVYSLDPGQRFDAVPAFDNDAEIMRMSKAMLEPGNHGYQIVADDDAAATSRIEKVVAAIAEGRLSPDTDFRTTWDALFADGASLRRG